MEERAPEFPTHEGKRQRAGLDLPERRVDFRNKPSAEAFMLLFVPQLRGRQIGLCLRADDTSASPSALEPRPDLLPR